MNISQIHTLLTCRQPEFQQAAICQLLSQEPTPWPDILALLPAIPEAVAEKLLTAVRRKHPFLRMGYGDPELVDGRRFENFQPLANELSRLVDCVREALSRPDCKRRQLLTTLTALPGIRHETRRCLQENQNDGELTWFDQACVPLPLQKPPRQFMLFVTYACNLRCPYCFAAGLQPDDMSWERAVGMLDWAVANQVETMTFCGGEPTRWAHFPAMLDEVKARGLNCYFATNLLPRPGVMERLTPDYVLSLIVHGALRSVYSDSQWNSFQRHLEQVKNQGVKVALRINFYTQGQDWEHLFGLAERLGIDEFQLAMAFPGSAEKNAYVAVDNLQKMIPDIVTFMQACAERNWRTVFSKPLPPCLFPEAMQMRLLTEQQWSPMCSVGADGYTHNACVSPTGEVSPCLSLLHHKLAFQQIKHWDDLSKYCREQIVPVLHAPAFERCHTCFLFARKLCQGLCLGHKSNPSLKVACR